VRVALFATCVNDAVLPRAAIATVQLLKRLGVEVNFPDQQSCCGQPQFNTGYRKLAEPLALRMARVFEDHEYVVVPSGSCVAMVRDNYPRIGSKALAEGRGSELAEAASALTPRVLELTEFVVDVLGITDVGAYFPHRVTYHPSCHGLRMLGLGTRPLALLRAVKGLELVELPGAEECCGFGGTFAVKNSDLSSAMGEDKLRNAMATGAEVLCGADNSCLLHLGTMLSRHGRTGADTAMQVVHLAEVLASTEARPWSHV
jgi:L-lactate dehydrogenase complex protein LldE